MSTTRAARLAAALLALLAPACGRGASDEPYLSLVTARSAVPERVPASLPYPVAEVCADGRARVGGELLDPLDRAGRTRATALLAERVAAMPTVRAHVDGEPQGPALPANPLRVLIDREASWRVVRAVVAVAREQGLFRFDLVVIDEETRRTGLLDLELERVRSEEGAAGRPDAPLFTLAAAGAAPGVWAVRRGEEERAFADPAELRAALASLEGIDPETRLVRLDAPADAPWERVAALLDELRRAQLRVWLRED